LLHRWILSEGYNISQILLLVYNELTFVTKYSTDDISFVDLGYE